MRSVLIHKPEELKIFSGQHMCLMCLKVNACVLALHGLCIQCASRARVHLCLSVTAVSDLHFCAFLKAQEVER